MHRDSHDCLARRAGVGPGGRGHCRRLDPRTRGRRMCEQSTRALPRDRNGRARVMKFLICLSFIWLLSVAQELPKKVNSRTTTEAATDPFDSASVETMAAQCVTLETELGPIEIAMLPQNAPEAVRNFLNLSATGA